jgi:2-succinyl-5-enolpyruvyl-6-hydroxy-3-cyclohexene-1-carboxylate synthase
LKGNLRIIVTNNHGGGIFRYIPGPDKTHLLEEFFEARHNWNAKYIARNFDVPYYSANNLNELNTILPKFFSVQPNNRPAVLEIFTPNEKNAEILKSYFNYLKD